MRFKVEYEVELTKEETREIAEEEGNEDEIVDDPHGVTEENLLNQIESCAEFLWTPDKIKVNHIL